MILSIVFILCVCILDGGQVAAWDQRIFTNETGNGAYGLIEKQKWFGIDELTYYRVKVKVLNPNNKMRIAI